MASTRSGDDTVLILEMDGDRFLLPASALERRGDHLHCRYDRDELRALRLREAARDEIVLPVVQEELQVSTREVPGTTYVVRTETQVETKPFEVDLEREAVTVERVPIDRFIDEAPDVREDDGLTVVPVVEEVLVVEKRLKLVEEIHIRRTKTVEREASTVEVRRQRAHVERQPPAPTDAP